MKKGVDISLKDGKRVVEGLGYYEVRDIGDLRELIKGSAAKYSSRAASSSRTRKAG